LLALPLLPFLLTRSQPVCGVSAVGQCVACRLQSKLQASLQVAGLLHQGLQCLSGLLLLRQIVLQSLPGAGLCMLDLLLVLHSRLAGVLGLLQLAFGSFGIGQVLLQLHNLLPGFSASGAQCFGLLPCRLIQRHCSVRASQPSVTAIVQSAGQ
jgi:hypothetical protein